MGFDGGNTMKLFVWKDVLCDYTCGMIICVAEDLESAKVEFEKTVKADWKMEEMPNHCKGATDDEPLIYLLDTLHFPICHYVVGGG